jgi:hypothetical protein
VQALALALGRRNSVIDYLVVVDFPVLNSPVLNSPGVDFPAADCQVKSNSLPMDWRVMTADDCDR